MSPKLSRQHQQIGEDYQTLCRLCLKKTSLKLDIYHEEGIQRDIPGKILNCLSLIVDRFLHFYRRNLLAVISSCSFVQHREGVLCEIQVTEDDNLPKFVCVSCIDKLDNFQDFRDMCHESENLLTNYVSAVEECNRTKQQYKAASTSSPHMRAGSKRKLNFSEPYPSPQREPVPDFVACKIKTEPQDTHLNVPPQQETFRDAWQPKPSTVVKSEPVEEQMTVDPSDIFGGSSSQQYPQTVAGTSSFGQQESAYLGASDDSAQFGASAFEDSDDDVVQLSPEEVEKTELKTERESPAGAGERYFMKPNARKGRNYRSASLSGNNHVQGTSGCFEGHSSEGSVTDGIGLNVHSNSAELNVHMCNTCGKVFANKYILRVHMRIHATERPYKCSICNKAFKQQQALQIHLKFHSGDKRHVCSVCDKSFVLSGDLKRHLQVHIRKPHLCNFCKRSFIQQMELELHVQIFHKAKH